MKNDESNDGKQPDCYVMDLSRPIEALGEKLTEVTLKDPGIGGLKGIEAAFGPKGMTIDLGSMPKLISEAGNIPLSSANTISLRDLGRHLLPIMGFFGADTPPTG